MTRKSKLQVLVLTMVIAMALAPAAAEAVDWSPAPVFVSTQLMSSPEYWWPVTSVMVDDTVWDWAAVTTSNSAVVTGGQVWFDVRVPGSDVWTPYGTPKDVASQWTVSDAYKVGTAGTYYFRAHYQDAASGDCEEVLNVACLEVCETAWAAEPVGQHRFVPKGNWGTYVHYTKGPGVTYYPLYAGQKYYAGDLAVWIVGSEVHMEFQSAPAPYRPGTIGQWSVIEVHVAVGNTAGDIPHAKSGNPIPGQFTFGWTGGRLGTVRVDPIPVGGLNDNFVIAAHAVMMWAGYTP